MDTKTKEKRIIGSIAFSLTVYLMAVHISPGVAIASLACLIFNLSCRVQDLQDIVIEGLTSISGNIKNTLSDNFDSLTKTLPSKIIESYEDRCKKEKEVIVEGLAKVEVRAGGVIDRQSALEVIEEFRKHGIHIPASIVKWTDDERIMEVAYNLIEMKAQAEEASNEI